MLGVAPHHGEHFVVTDVVEHVEGVGASLEQRHLLEAGAPRAVVPQHGDQRQVVAQRRLDVPSTDAETAIADHQHDLLARPRQLHADAHANAMTDGRQRPGASSKTECVHD